MVKTPQQGQIPLMNLYAMLTTVVCIVLLGTSFARQNEKPRFTEIDVERINIIEPNGQVKLVIANKERLPGPIVAGKEYPRVGLKSSGILFYNDKGDENGGLRTASNEVDGKYVAGAGLAFDKYDGDEVIGIRYNDENGNRTALLRILDQPDASQAEQKKNFEESQKLPLGPERDRMRRQAVANQRVLIGTGVDKSATITLFDGNSRPRLRMSVSIDGEAKLEFLDTNGTAVQTLPASSKP
jgi:hypothetical protein